MISRLLPFLFLTAAHLQPLYAITAHNLYKALPYLDTPVVATNASDIRQYNIKSNYEIRCGWHPSSLLSGVNNAQGPLLLKDDYNNISCQLFDASTTGALTAAQVQADVQGNATTYSPPMNLYLKAFIQNGTTALEQLFDDSNYNISGIFAMNLSRTALGTSKYSATLPWQVQVSAGIQNLTNDYSEYFPNNFTLLDESTQPYLHWDFGTRVSSISPMTRPPIVFRNPCTAEVFLVVVFTGNDNHVHFGRTTNIENSNPSVYWFDMVLPTSNASCSVQKVTAMVRYLVLHTTCGAFMSNNLMNMSLSTSVNFTQNPLLADITSGSSSVIATNYCYMKRNSEALPFQDAFLYMDSAQNTSILVEPFTTKLTPLNSYQYPNPKDISPNYKYRRSLFSTIQNNRQSVLATYRSSLTSVYYALIQQQSTKSKSSTSAYTVYSQGFNDLITSQRTARPLFNVPGPSNTSKPFVPAKFLANPVTGDLFLVGNQVYILAANGGAFRKIFDVPQISSTTDAVSDILFAPNGVLCYIVTNTSIVYQGNAYNGPFLKQLTFSPPLSFDLSGKPSGITVNGAGQLTTVSATTTGITIVIAPDPQPDARTGTYVILGFTSRGYLLIEWSNDASSSTFSNSDMNRKVQTNSTDGPTGYVIGYISAANYLLPNITATTTPTTPSGILFVEQSVPLRSSAVTPGTSVLTIANTSDINQVTCSISPGLASALTAGMTVICEHFEYANPLDANSSNLLQFRASLLVIGTPTATTFSATTLLGNRLNFAESPNQQLTCKAGEWKVFQIASQLTISDDVACPVEFTENRSTRGPPIVNTDRNDVVNVSVRLKPKDVQANRRSFVDFLGQDISHEAGGPWRLSIHTELTGNNFDGFDLKYQAEDVKSSFQVDNNVTSLNFRIANPTLGCTKYGASLIPITVVSGPPKGTNIEYTYPDGQINNTVWNNPNILLNVIKDPVLSPIPVNYRPPSNLGHAFPTSFRIYNADPSKPYEINAGYRAKHYPVQFQQCPSSGKNHAACGCTEAMERSFAPEKSDCLQKAVFLPHPGDHYFRFHAYRGYMDQGILDNELPLLVTEVNNRSDFEIDPPANLSNTVLGLLQQYYPDQQANLFISNTSIRFLGTGLYHFEVKKLPLDSYSNAITYMAFFLYSAGLPFPLGNVCQCWMCLAVALWLFPALRASGERTLLDYQKHTAVRPPDRVPLKDEWADRDGWDDADLEAEVAAF